ncbi:hypothetical protein IEQ34_003735 [Dendrobium chrysotoxum]|uniref:Uncharacterized protein n=1 Tax=Dendrobium chrysotoxum TaxID=161865 RepID=A0AAV7HC96_DENCH|nr:hypothetical protein IEQ34_003735 [Dendrobium chrysotoxum]
MGSFREAILVVLVCFLVAVAAAPTATEKNLSCYCRCMLKSCTKINGLTVRICGAACDRLCKYKKQTGKPSHGDKYCGLKVPASLHTSRAGEAGQFISGAGRLVRRFIPP